MSRLNYIVIEQCVIGKILENVIGDFKDKGYNFNHIAETNIKTIANKMDMSYNFYFKHNMQAVEWKLNANKKN